MEINSNEKCPLVSIFCTCKNSKRSIRRCIDSILSQDYPNIEIIVQDGASTDGTLEILQGYGERIQLVSQPDSGADEAFHRALARINGTFFGSCLSDEELLPHAVSRAVENLQKHPDAAAVYGDHFVTDLDGRITGEVHPRPWDFESYFCSEWTPPFCASFFRTLCLKTLEKDEYSGADEFNFWISLGSKYPIRYVPGFVAKYTDHPGQLSRQANTRKQRIADRKKAIERLCNDPRTPEHIRSLREKALAGLTCWSVESYIQLRDWNLAREYALEAFQKAPNTDRIRKIAERFYSHGLGLYQRGDLKSALEYVNLLIECGVVGAELEQIRTEILHKLSQPSRVIATTNEPSSERLPITEIIPVTHKSSSANDIPVILVCYNRPKHTLQVLKALREQNI
ncbi:MAG: glycosyltransferase, partial [Sedimentisphaerales bacterium]|nr:glycosyltransferase [Sedimentisphaerales bacterium]